MLHHTNWGWCYPVKKLPEEVQTPAQPHRNLLWTMQLIRYVGSYSLFMLIKFSIVANPACKHIIRKLANIYQCQDLPRLEEKLLWGCLPNLYSSFLHFCCFGNQPATVYISWLVLTRSLCWQCLENLRVRGFCKHLHCPNIPIYHVSQPKNATHLKPVKHGKCNRSPLPNSR